MDIDRGSTSLPERGYRLLLRLYPRRFREEAEPELIATFRDGWRETAGAGRLAQARYLRLILADLGRTLVLEWTPSWRQPPTGQLWAGSGISPARSNSRVDTLWQDLRYALRTLRASPLATVVAAVTIAIGVGATTTIFSVANALLLRTPPGIVAPRDLVTVHAVSPDGSSFHAFSHRGFEHLREAGGGLQDLAAWSTAPAVIATDGDPELLVGMGVSANYFSLLGARPVQGRLLVPEDDAGIAGPRVVVLSHAAWQRRFAGDPSLVGQVINLNGEPFTVVGVAEPGFQGHVVAVDVAAWIPIGVSLPPERAPELANPRASWIELLGRLAPGTTPAQAAAALTTVQAQFMAGVGFEGQRGVDVRRYAPVPAPALLPVAGFLGMLVILTGLILLIASANVANMLLARAAGRGREIAVRLALGASRTRLVRQLLTESMLLFAFGGASGILVAVWLTGVLSQVRPPIPVPILLDFSVDLPVLLAALALTLLTGITFGLAPALQSTRPDLTRSLKDEPGLVRVGRHRIRGAFVVAQVAATTLLLVVAGLFIRTLGRAASMELGFEVAGLHAVMSDLRVQRYTPEQTLAFIEEVQRQAAELPGVTSVGAIDILPLNMSNQTSVLAIEGRDPVEGVGRFETDFARATPGYLGTIGIPIVRGRGLAPTDRDGGPAVAVINEALARRVWPGEDPVGKLMQFGSFTEGTLTEVVGVARDSKYRSLGDRNRPMVYLAAAQQAPRDMALLVRTAPGGPDPAPALRALVRQLDPDLPLLINRPYREVIGISLLPNRIATLVAGVFGVTGLVLATVGLYGVLAFTVQRRRREIGVRMALGAGNARIRRLVLRDGMRLTGIGLLVGLATAALVGQLLGGLLLGLSPLDPVTYLGIAALMLTTALLACLEPVRRALRTTPVEVLRHD